MAYDIHKAIPHREPFLLLDEIRELTCESVHAGMRLDPEHALWKQIYSGHYPGNPITPGVLLVEIMLQAAAVLAAEIMRDEATSGVPVVTRLRDVKFRHMVAPGSDVDVRVNLTERLGQAFFMKGTVRTGGRTAVQAEFAVAIADPDTKQE